MVGDEVVTRWSIAVWVSLAVHGAALWTWSGFGIRVPVSPTEAFLVNLVPQQSLLTPAVQRSALKQAPSPAPKQTPQQSASDSPAPRVSPKTPVKALQRATAPELLLEPLPPQAQPAAVVAAVEARQHTVHINGGGDSATSLPSRAVPATAAAYLTHPQPEMPYLSRVRGESGEVKLWVKVGVRGEPLQVKVEKSSGFSRLDNAAQNKVATEWRFDPARRDGVAVEGEVRFSIFFKLIAAP